MKKVNNMSDPPPWIAAALACITVLRSVCCPALVAMSCHGRGHRSTTVLLGAVALAAVVAAITLSVVAAVAAAGLQLRLGQGQRL